MYDWRGKFIEPDDDKPQQRRHCCKCGSFLPKDPTTVTKMYPVDYSYIYDEQGEVSSLLVHRFGQQEDWIWPCTKCHYKHNSDEIWK